MRIAQVNTSESGGGAESVAASLHRAYRAAGHDASLYVGPQRSAAAGVVGLANGAGIWRAHDTLRRAGHPRAARVVKAFAAPRTIGDTVRGREDFVFPGTRALVGVATKADVVQLHNLHGAYFDLRLLPDLCARANVVLCPHDQWPVTGHAAYCFECERWRTGCGSCPHLRTYPALLVDGTAANWRAKAVLYGRSSLCVGVPSAWLADIVSDSMLAPAVRELRIIPNGVDLALFRPRDRDEVRTQLGLPQDALVVACGAQPARAAGFKDPGTLRAALVRLGAIPGPDVRVVVFGGEPGPAERLGRLVVEAVGPIPQAQVALRLAAADLYLHASRADTFPLAVVEALACGVPVVASSVGGIPEQLGDDTGRLVPVGDPESMAEAAAVLLADGPRRAAMGKAAAAEARRRFDFDRQAGSYLAWFEELIC